MAKYVFETMSAGDAGTFATSDQLFFASAGVTAIGVTHVAAGTGGSNGGAQPNAQSVTTTTTP